MSDSKQCLQSAEVYANYSLTFRVKMMQKQLFLSSPFARY